MPVNVLEALEIIFNFCIEQDSCPDCPMKDICEKMPCEWDLF